MTWKKTYTYSQGLHFSSVTFHSTSNPLRSSYHSAAELLSYKFLLERNLFTLHIKAFVNRNIQFNYIKFMDLSNSYQQSVQVTKSINKLIQQLHVTYKVTMVLLLVLLARIFRLLYKIGRSPSKKENFCYLRHWRSFKNDEKCILFHLKRFFPSQDI